MPKARYLEFRKPIVAAKPPGATPADLIRALGDSVRGQGLPAGWQVSQEWRNGPNAPWKIAPIDKMIADSAGRGGDFVGIYLDRFLRRHAERYGVSLRGPRPATQSEIAEEAERQERVAERESGEFEALARQQKRKAAAAKGVETKRARKAAKAAAAEKRKLKAEARRRALELAAQKRSAAAKKGWETRRRNAAKAKRKRGKK